MHRSKKQPCRSAPRINVRSNQIAYLNFQSGNGGIVLDVSANGLGFQAVEPLETNESLPFRLSVPGFAHLPLSGRIAWLDETRKRGGLRVVVPAPQQRTFELWQRQYLGPQPAADQPVPDPRGPAPALEPKPAPKQSRISPSVLAACLLVVLCAALAGASQFLPAARRAGVLLSHLGRKFSSEGPQAVSAAAPPHPTSPPVSRAPQSATHAAISAHLDALSVPVPSSAQSGLDSNSTGAPAVASPPYANAPSAAPLIAKVSPAIANHSVGENSPNAHALARAAIAPPAQHRETRRGASALAPGVYSRPVPAARVPSRRIAAQQASPVNIGSPQTSPAALPLVAASQPSPAPESQAPAPSQNFQPCQLVNSVQPAYPKNARKQNVQGDVQLRLVVGSDGMVRNVAPLGGPPLLVAAAVNAARQFRYTPAILNGKPIETIQTVRISFKLDQQ